MSLSTARVLAAAAAFRWVPDDSLRRLTNDEFDAIEFPHGYESPMMVHLDSPHRPPDELVACVYDVMHEWGLTEVGWWLTPQAPTEYVSAIRALAGQVAERVSVLAYDLSTPLPAWEFPRELTVELVHDQRTLRAAEVVAAEVWGGALPQESDLDERLAATQADLVSFRVVAFLDAEPAATGRCTVTGADARLWGACTREDRRGRGAYRAVLLERLRGARDRGASMAWCTGRSTTSAPILLRAGFQDFGTHECYRSVAVGLRPEPT